MTIAAGPVDAPISSTPVRGPSGEAELREQLLLEREQALRAVVEAGAGVGGDDATARAVQKLRAEPLLERPHLLADGGLRDAERCAAREKLSRSTTAQNAASCRVSITTAYSTR